jgi:predicted amidophosphoribosyltransferase
VLEFPLLAATHYENTARKWILDLKTKPTHRQSIELNQWVSKIVEHWAPEIISLKPNTIVPVPSNPWRVLTERSLSLFLGNQVSNFCGIPLATRLLSLPWLQTLNLGSKKSQKFFSRIQRFQNEGRFKCSIAQAHKLKRPLKVLLVDDVCTTGATLSHVAAILQKEGIPVVGAFVLSKVQ